MMEKLNNGSSGHKELTKWSRAIEELSTRIEAKSTRWLELSEQFD